MRLQARSTTISLVRSVSGPSSRSDRRSTISSDDTLSPDANADVLIAGQAVARNLFLVTHNTQEFGRVPRLRFEDWES
jgi:predicted nucleic acid-binding protein